MKNILFVSLLAFSSSFSYAADKSQSPQIIEVQVTENGFEPSQIEVNSDTPVTLKVTRKTESTCATEILMKEKKVNKPLPLNETVSIDLGKIKKGKHIFSCAMNMIKGQIISK